MLTVPFTRLESIGKIPVRSQGLSRASVLPLIGRGKVYGFWVYDLWRASVLPWIGRGGVGRNFDLPHWYIPSTPNPEFQTLNP